MAPVLTRLSSGGGFGFSKITAAAASSLPSYLRPDEYGAYLVLAMPLNGNYNDYAYLYNGGLTESSRTWSASTGAGGVVEFQSSQYKYYNNALRTYNGTGGAYVSTSNMTTANFEFPGDFTIECWVWIDSGASDVRVLSSMTSLTLPNGGDGAAGFNVRGVGSGLTGTFQGSCLGDPDRGNSGWGYGAWHHAAISRSGSTFYYWYDGGGFGSRTISGTYPAAHCAGATALQFACANIHVPNKNVYMNDVRVYKGVNKYTSGFTPPDKMYIG